MRGPHQKLYDLAKEMHKKNGKAAQGDLASFRELYEACRAYYFSLEEVVRQTVLKNMVKNYFPRQWQWWNLSLLLTPEEISLEIAEALSKFLSSRRLSPEELHVLKNHLKALSDLREKEIPDDFNVCALFMLLLIPNSIFRLEKEDDNMILAVLFLPYLFRRCKGVVPVPLRPCYRQMGIIDENGVLDLASTSAEKVLAIQESALKYMSAVLFITAFPEDEFVQWLKKELGLASAKIISRNNEVIITPDSQKISGFLESFKKWGLAGKEIQMDGVFSFSLDTSVCLPILLQKIAELWAQNFQGPCEYITEIDGKHLKISFFDRLSQAYFLNKNPTLRNKLNVIEASSDNYSSVVTLSLTQAVSLLNPDYAKVSKKNPARIEFSEIDAGVEMLTLNPSIPASNARRNRVAHQVVEHKYALKPLLLDIIMENAKGASGCDMQGDTVSLGIKTDDKKAIKKSLAQLGLKEPEEKMSPLGESVVLVYGKIDVDHLIEKWILKPTRDYLRSFSPHKIVETENAHIILSFLDIQSENCLRLTDQHPILAARQNTDENFVTKITLDADAIKALLSSARAEKLNSAEQRLI